MYIAATIMTKIKPGTLVSLEKDSEFGEIAVKELGGMVIGYILHSQPQGCVSAFRAMQKINNERVLTEVAIVSGDIAILTGKTSLFENIDKAAVFSNFNHA